MKLFIYQRRRRPRPQVKAVHLSPVPFTAENGLLTPSFKLKRDVALKTFQKDIDMLYENIGDKVRIIVH